MKKTNFMTAVLLVVAILLMAACTPIPGNNAPTPSSSLAGGLEDNTLFGDGNATTQPTSAATQPTSTATQPSSVVTQPTTAATQPTSAVTQPTTPPDPGEGVDYQTFLAMTGAEQRAFQDSFPSVDAFFAWYNAAKAAHEQANPPIEIDGSGTVTLPTTP